MSLVNIRNTKYASQFNIDKIIPDAKFSGSFSVSASSIPGSFGNIGTKVIAHSFGENVLQIMIWSTDNADYLEAGTRDFTAGGTLTPKASATCAVDPSNLTVVGQNFTGSALTFYYEIILTAEN